VGTKYKERRISILDTDHRENFRKVGETDSPPPASNAIPPVGAGFLSECDLFRTRCHAFFGDTEERDSKTSNFKGVIDSLAVFSCHEEDDIEDEEDTKHTTLSEEIEKDVKMANKSPM
jgi:hypothetical protein